MARVTIEKCLEKVHSHFDLVLVVAERAKQISNGRKSQIIKKGIKSHVTALREIEDGTISADDMRIELINSLHNIKSNYEHKSNDNIEMLEEIQSSDFIHGEDEVLEKEDNLFSETVEEVLFSDENSDVLEDLEDIDK